MDVSSVVSRFGDDTLSCGVFPASSPKRETIPDIVVWNWGSYFESSRITKNHFTIA